MAGDRAGSRAAGRKRIHPLLAVLATFLIAVFAGLGTWQVYRLQWKLDLIARVEARVHAAPVVAPSAASWGGVASAPQSYEYLRVRLTGAYLYDLTTPVQALTEQGSGYWLLTPLCMADGTIILVNRGFIPSDLGAPTRYAPQRASGNPCAGAAPQTSAQVTITGLLRTNETGGPFTRANDPANNRWFARDVPAIAAARGLAGQGAAVAPFFVDAAAGQNPAGSPDRPQGGLTVVAFHNSHLVYAVTWYLLAAMVAGAWWWLRRERTGTEHDGHDD